MHRRNFLASSAACGLATAALPQSAHAQTADDPRQFLEWRTYRLAGAAQQSVVDAYLQSAAVPAWQRLGLGPIGVFKEIGDDAGPHLHVLLTYPSLALFAAAREALERDPEYQKNAIDYLAAALDDPAFERVDSALLIAFAGMPRPARPANKSAVYELRTYESHSEERARKKIDMFNRHEITLFPKCGFEDVFFGETLVGAGLPNLKYMLAAADMAANEAGWGRFINHPDWAAVKDLPEYKDTVSKIHKLYLQPTAYSQL